jgi:hypothetical protein
MMILHNFSVETDCCNCCKDDPYARIPQPIMDSINNGLRQKTRSQTLYQNEKQKERYWICTKKYVQVVILADFLLAPLLLSNGKDP